MGEKTRLTVKTPETKKGSLASKTQRPDFSQHMSSPIDHILFLQRTIGNQAVQRLLKGTGFRGQETEIRIQPKLTIGQPNDVYEQEADRVAEQVMRMPGKQYTANRPLLDVILLNRGSGQVLDDNTLSFMEEGFDYDFSHVRLHADSYAAKKAEELNAEAFTIGSEIFFNTGRYNTSSPNGKMLLAHELMHVVQSNKNSIELWSAEGHRTITREALEGDERFSPSAKHVLTETTPTLDYNRPQILQDMVSFWTGESLYRAPLGFLGGAFIGGITPPGQGYQIGETRISGILPQAILGAAGVRVGPELCEHGEARRDINIECMTNHINDAVESSNECKTVEGLVNLGYALHTAQDRASHGEGYTEGLAAVRPSVPHKNLDTIATNPEGHEKAILNSKEAINIFYPQLLELKKEEIQTLVIPPDWKSPIIETILPPLPPPLPLTIEPERYPEGGVPWGGIPLIRIEF